MSNNTTNTSQNTYEGEYREEKSTQKTSTESGKAKNYPSTIKLIGRGYINDITRNITGENTSYFVKCTLQMGMRDGENRYQYLSVLVGREVVRFIERQFEARKQEGDKFTYPLTGQNFGLTLTNVSLDVFEGESGSKVNCEAILVDISVSS